VNLYNKDKPDVYLCEGWGDGLALWEILRSVKRSTDKNATLSITGAEAASIYSQANVLAVPGANVFYEQWCPLFEGKRVFLLYDNDHPRKHNGKTIEGVGYAGMRRAAQILGACRQPPKEIHYLNWGRLQGKKEYHDLTLKTGFDIRDALSQGKTATARIPLLSALLSKLEPIPEDWIPGRSKETAKAGGTEIAPIECKEWKKLIDAWKKPLKMRQSLEDTLAVMLAVAISTMQSGDQQLFLQVIGDAGSAKSRFCNGLLVSKHCFALEHLTGFHSGWKDASGEDFSLIARINHKTLITPEGDVLTSSPHFQEIMSQQRKIFDGSSKASYKNRAEDMEYTGLRTPWIIAGTPALMDTDQSRLGDRFIRVFIDPPTAAEEREILMRVGHTALRSVRQMSNCDPSTHVEENLLIAYQLTGGYVNYLRDNSTTLLDNLDLSNSDEVVEYCSILAEFTAYIRARPNTNDKKVEKHDTKELPTRLTSQFCRLAACLAAVLSKSSIDKQVFRILRKVALDTCRGRTLDLIKILHEPKSKEGLSTESLAIKTVQTPLKEKEMLQFLRKIGAIDLLKSKERISMNGTWRWKLSEAMSKLCGVVLSA
jgi:hypothetical protein